MSDRWAYLDQVFDPEYRRQCDDRGIDPYDYASPDNYDAAAEAFVRIGGTLAEWREAWQRRHPTRH